jgi:hypothetical protein
MYILAYVREKQQRLTRLQMLSLSLCTRTHTNINTTNKPETIRTINKTLLAMHSLNGVGRMPADKFPTQPMRSQVEY